MPKVKVLSNFIGTPEEVEQNKGEVPSNITESLKGTKKKLTDEEIASFDHIISRGSTIEVTEQRAKELAGLGLVEYQGITPKTVAAEQTKEKVNIRATEEKKTGEKVKNVKPAAKNKAAGPHK